MCCVCCMIIIIILDSPKLEDDGDDDPYVTSELKGFKIITTLNLVFSFCICVCMLILIKDKLKKLRCIAKKFRKNIVRRRGRLPTKSEIDLKKIQAYMSTSDDDNDHDSVMFERESVC